MNGDRWIALIGIAMALTLVLANGGLRRLPLRSKAWMAAAWVFIIIVAAFAFSQFRR